VPVGADSPYTTDVNLWVRSIEYGVLDDPWLEPPRGPVDACVGACARPGVRIIAGARIHRRILDLCDQPAPGLNCRRPARLACRGP